MQNRLALVIAVDGLRASALGTYGNTAFPTPQLDDLASRSLVVEWLLAESPELDDFYREVCPATPDEKIRRWVVTDDPTIVPLVESGFDEVVRIERGPSQSAAELAETQTARFFVQAVEQLALWQKDAAEQNANGLLWVHFSGLCGPWDVPLQLRSELMDEDDPLPAEFVDPPALLSSVDDPDELLKYRVAYAAQVAVLESCLAGVVEAFEEMSHPGEKLAMILGSRGFSLGEHGCVGQDCGTLYSEQLHLPWLIMTPQTREPLPRVSGFARPSDIQATLNQWFNSAATSESPGMSLTSVLAGVTGQLRLAAISGNRAGEQMIRTPAWLLKQGESTELYSKPDDRWEANDVASLCPEIVQVLGECLQKREQLAKQALPEELLFQWR
ncbi:MAG: hypothetical protein SH868_19105 [Bythopirellula sp.]|nr:hypothetical protein [Bythopirellula sp.]